MAKHAALVVALLLVMVAASMGQTQQELQSRRHRSPPYRHRTPPPKYHCGHGSVCQDPVLKTERGEAFYFHGHKDADFCLVSDTNLHINAHFVGLRPASGTRDFTWVQALGVLFGRHQLYIGVREVAEWDAAQDQLLLLLDSVPIDVPAVAGGAWSSDEDAGVTVTRVDAANSVEVEIGGAGRLTVFATPVTEEEDAVHGYGVRFGSNCMAHLDVSFQFSGLTEQVAGVLGQTYAPTFRMLQRKPGSGIPTMGGKENYVTSGVLAPDCAVARFEGAVHGAGLLPEEAMIQPVTCGTGGTGLGFVCRR